MAQPPDCPPCGAPGAQTQNDSGIGNFLKDSISALNRFLKEFAKILIKNFR